MDVETELLRGPHPMLIDRNSGTIFEWANGQKSGSPDGPMTDGYANADDHDWVWSREELESDPKLDIVEFARLSNGEISRLAAERDWS